MSLNPETELARFGLREFRPGQREVIDAILAGQDCLCVMPTGGGKSLCYQLPAVAGEGLTLVVSPLIALMKDQVDALESLGMRATFINSTLDPAQQQLRLDQMAAGAYDLVYVVPERFRSPRFLRALERANLQRFAIDEAHCISEWGHDFRPDYARLGEIRRRIGNPPTVALTATATPRVQQDIVEQLGLREPRVLITGFARENLSYAVVAPSSQPHKEELLLEFLRETPGSGIIYASTRKRCEEVAQLLRRGTKRSVCVYHAGMTKEERDASQEAFMRGDAEIVIATTAFGMGIDKADVRFVVHYNLPGTLEGYYQEAGRAGRDGKPARCLMLFSPGDSYVQEFFIECAYPPLDVVEQVYDMLRSYPDDPIELTQEEIKERLGLSLGGDSVGACERLLEKAGVLERLDPRQNMALVRITSRFPTLVDLLPRTARVQRRVVQELERLVGQRRDELVYLSPQLIAERAELDGAALSRALRQLRELPGLEYVPPFRGRAIHVRERERPFEELDIDFAAYEQRKQAEYEKLEQVLRFARSRGCRQTTILRYFGDQAAEDCGRCDNCRSTPRSGGANTLPDDEATLELVRKVLSGVARTHGRFGKNLIAQMLCGSNSARIKQLRLDRLSTYGLLGHLRQTDIVELIEALLASGHLEQVELEPQRPVLSLTAKGDRTMRGQEGLAGPLPVSAKLVHALAPRDAKQTPESGVAAGPVDVGLLDRLKRWRREQSEVERVPAYRVLANATLEELARVRPRSISELEGIKGIGPAKLKAYGDAVLQLMGGSGPAADAAPQQVAEPPVESAPADAARNDAALEGPSQESYSSNEPPLDDVNTRLLEQEVDCEVPDDAGPGIAADTQSSGDAVSMPVAGERPTHYWTWRMLQAGFSPAECAAARGLEQDTVLDHAIWAADAGWPVEMAWFLSDEKRAALADALEGEARPRMRTILERLPGMRYEEVQLYLKCRNGTQSRRDG